MNNLDRGLIKAQARQLIKGKVWKLFFTYAIIIICIVAVSLIPAISSFTNMVSSLKDFSDSYDYDITEEAEENGFYDGFNLYEDEFNNFGSDVESGLSDFYNFGSEIESELNDFYNFGNNASSGDKQIVDSPSNMLANATKMVLSSLSMTASTVIEIALLPLSIALAYFFVLFIRGKEFRFGEGVKVIFKETFKKRYFTKLWSLILTGIIAYLLSLLFIIPGIVFGYSMSFVAEILCDNPQLSAWQAMKISKKMCKGNRTELFVLDLSFIPWILLCVFIAPAIYVIPYMATTKALYYENFRIRAMQQGRITEDDFLTEVQKMQKYSAQSTGTYQKDTIQQSGYSESYAAPQNTYEEAPTAEQTAYEAPAANEEPTPEPQTDYNEASEQATDISD